ncbi:MAG: hypothetical protein HWD58_12780 [Bacteroidota bacterium]|nr:MAG: hypothetical protein HWD58_12780 [Bacteroidota bacterium]
MPSTFQETINFVPLHDSLCRIPVPNLARFQFLDRNFYPHKNCVASTGNPATPSKKQNVSIRISQTEWTQSVFVKADEIILNGRLFDIRHVQQDAFGVLLYGHYDTKETRLVSLQNKHRGRINHREPLKLN